MVTAFATTGVAMLAVTPTVFAIEHHQQKPVIQDVYEEVRMLQEQKEVEKSNSNKETLLDDLETIDPMKVSEAEKEETLKLNEKTEEVSKAVDDLIITSQAVSNEQVNDNENSMETNVEKELETPVVESEGTVEQNNEGLVQEEVVDEENEELLEVNEKVEEQQCDELVKKEPSNEDTGLYSNDDKERRNALEKEFGIQLTNDIQWEDKKGQTTTLLMMK